MNINTIHYTAFGLFIVRISIYIYNKYTMHINTKHSTFWLFIVGMGISQFLLFEYFCVTGIVIMNVFR